MTLSELVARHASTQPEAPAFVGAGRVVTWREHHERADAIAATLVDRFPDPRARIGVQMPDGPDVHLLYLAAERAGLVVVGIGPRAGAREVAHLVRTTGALTVLDALPPESREPAVDRARAFTADELWFLNSTSGTTGLPKVVRHHQARWFAFHDLAVQGGGLHPGDVFLSALPAPFGFGLWTAHCSPTILGAPCVRLPGFTPETTIAAIEAHRVTVLAAVSTQFVMLLESAALAGADLTSLRVLYTGGERVPAERAAAFEDRTGCRVLQFYGSNETGALSMTTLADDDRVRLTTAGHVIPSMRVRLLDPDTGADVTATGGPGIAACRGPLTCLGYDADDAANAELVTADGWMRTGDLCAVDADGVLTVVGRAADVIIRGGKNVSAAEVEAEVSTHPAVALVAAVAMPDPVFGERVCVYLVGRDGAPPPDLPALREHLAARGVGKELWPEHVVAVTGDLPRSSGGKVAKAALREDAARRAAAPPA